MSFSITRTKKISLFQNNNTFFHITGGWKVDRNVTNATQFIASAPFYYTASTNLYQYIYPVDASGSMLFVIDTDNGTDKHQIAALTTANIINFYNLKRLHWLFTIDGPNQSYESFERDIEIQILDKDRNIIRKWNSMEKLCCYEKGELNISGIDSGYIRVYVDVHSKLPEFIDRYYLLTKYGGRLRTADFDGNKYLIGQNVTRYSLIFQILNMWVE